MDREIERIVIDKTKDVQLGILNNPKELLAQEIAKSVFKHVRSRLRDVWTFSAIQRYAKRAKAHYALEIKKNIQQYFYNHEKSDIHFGNYSIF